MFRLPAFLFFAAALLAQSPGAIVAVGGGGTTSAVVARTLELAGGKNAIVAVLPQAPELPTAGDGAVKMWNEAGAKSVRVVSVDNRNAARTILRGPRRSGYRAAARAGSWRRSTAADLPS